MADRFPALEDIGPGKVSAILLRFSPQIPAHIALLFPLNARSRKANKWLEGQTSPRGNGTTALDSIGAGSDFLTRERAALGDDAAQFASANDNAATVEDGGDDLLGGGEDYQAGAAGGEEITEFESSYPAVDTRNNVGHYQYLDLGEEN